jgi:transposase
VALRQTVSALHDYTLGGLSKLLERCDLRYKRGRLHIHSPDPDYDTKLAYIAAARLQMEQQPEEVALVYADELTYYRRPSLAQAYARRGAHAAAVESGYRSNTHRRIAAALDVHSGALFAWQRAAFPVPTLLHFLQALAERYSHAQRVFVVMDNWSVHFDPRILVALQATKLTLLRLPTYAPWTNPVEKVWLRLKQEVLHHHPFADDWHGLQAAVQDWLNQWTDASPQLLHAVGLSPY